MCQRYLLVCKVTCIILKPGHDMCVCFTGSMRYFFNSNSEKTSNKSCYSLLIFFVIKYLRTAVRLLRFFCGFGLGGFLEGEEQNYAFDNTVQDSSF